MFTYPFTLHHFQRWAARPDRRGVGPEVERYPFLLRSITRLEYAQWRSQYPDARAFEDRLLAEAVLAHPPHFREEAWDWDRVWAGIVHQVVQKILSLSGFGAAPDPEVLLPSQQYLQGEESKYDLVIMMALNLTLDQILAMDTQIWHRTVGLAMQKLQLMQFDPDWILDPAAAEKRAQEAMGKAKARARGRSGAVPAGGAGERTEAAFSFTAD